jgi:hypothetical protein
LRFSQLGFEELYLIGYNTTKSVECYLLHAGFLLGSFFHPEGVGDMFLQNIGRYSMKYTASYPKRKILTFFLILYF